VGPPTRSLERERRLERPPAVTSLSCLVTRGAAAVVGVVSCLHAASAYVHASGPNAAFTSLLSGVGEARCLAERRRIARESAHARTQSACHRPPSASTRGCSDNCGKRTISPHAPTSWSFSVDVRRFVSETVQ
jgi:hypothetical protein